MFAIFKKELHTYFTSIIGWLFLSALFLAVGLYHWIINYLYAYGSFSYALSNSLIFVILLIPIFTMRIIAEESHQKTDQLLYTAPVSIVKIVLGKYLALVAIFLMAIAVFCLYPLVLTRYGKLNLKEEYLALATLFVLGCTYITIGMFISSLFESQILAAIVSMLVFALTLFSNGIAGALPTDSKSVAIIIAFLWLLVSFIFFVLTRNLISAAVLFIIGFAAILTVYMVKPVIFDGALVKILGSMGVANHVSDGMSGIFNLSDFVYMLSVSFMFLFFTVQSINKKRWA